MDSSGNEPTLRDQMRYSDRQLRKTGREIERDRRELERDEKKLELEIKNAAKTGNKQVVTILVKQLMQLRKQKARSYVANGKIKAWNAQTKVMGANAKLAGSMNTLAKCMSSVNNIMKPEQLSATMQQFAEASAQIDMSGEVINDALDDILNESGDEEESEGIVQQVLDEIGIDISAKVMQAPSAPGKIAISASKETADLEARMAKLKS